MQAIHSRSVWKSTWRPSTLWFSTSTVTKQHSVPTSLRTMTGTTVSTHTNLSITDARLIWSSIHPRNASPTIQTQAKDATMIARTPTQLSSDCTIRSNTRLMSVVSSANEGRHAKRESYVPLFTLNSSSDTYLPAIGSSYTKDWWKRTTGNTTISGNWTLTWFNLFLKSQKTKWSTSSGLESSRVRLLLARHPLTSLQLHLPTTQWDQSMLSIPKEQEV